MIIRFVRRAAIVMLLVLTATSAMASGVPAARLAAQPGATPRAFVGDLIQAIRDAVDGLTYRIRVTDPNANGGQPQEPFNALAFPLADPGDLLCGVGPCDGGVDLADGDADVDVDVDVTVALNGDLVVELRRIGGPAFGEIEVLLDIPGTEQVAVFGYDARQGGTPGQFVARFGFDSTDASTAVSMSLTSQNPSASLAVIGGLFTEGPVPPGANIGAIIDPFTAAVTLSSQALDVTANVSVDRVAHTFHSDVRIGQEQVPGSVNISDTRFGHTRTLTASIRDFPADVAVDAVLPPDGQQAQVHYTASSVIRELDVLARDHDDDLRTPDITARVIAQGIPTDILVTATPGLPGQATHIEYHTSGPMTALTASVNGLVGKINSAVLAVQNPPTDLIIDAGPGTGELHVVAGANQQVGDLDVKLRQGPSLPQDTLPGAAEGLLVRESFGNFSVHGHVRGLRQLHTTQRTSTDSSGFHRTIRSATLATDPALPDRPFRVRVELPGPDATEPAETAEATLNALPATLTLAADVTTTATGAAFRTLVDYTASEQAQSLVLDTDMGTRVGVRAVLTGVPTRLNACLGASTVCTGTVVRTGGTSVKVQVDRPVHLDLFDCVEGPATGCTPSNAIEFTHISGLTLAPVGSTRGTLSAAVVPPPVDPGQVGQVFFDTDNTPINGHIRTGGQPRPTYCDPNPGPDGADITLDDVRAQDRDMIIALRFFTPCWPSGVVVAKGADGQRLEFGTMVCGSGTNIDVKPGFGGNLTAGPGERICTTGP